MSGYVPNTTAEEILAEIEEEIVWTLEENPTLSREDIVSDIAEAVLRDVQQRGLKAQIRRRLGI